MKILEILRSKRSRPTIVLGAVIVITIVLKAFIWPYLSTQSMSAQFRMPPVAVTAAVVEKAAIYEEIQAVGTTRAWESVELTSTVTDKIREINFEDGQFVEQGTVIVRFRSEEEDAELLGAKARLEDSKRRLSRDIKLYKEGSLSREEFEESMLRAKDAQAAYKRFSARVDDRVMRAPFSGLLGLRDLSAGALVKPGDLITTIDDISQVKVDFPVPASALADLQVGQQIEALASAYDGSFTGEVVSINSRVDANTRAVTVRSVIDNADMKLRPGMLVKIILKTKPRTALVLPEEAIMANGKQKSVYKISKDSKAELMPITIGARYRGTVEIVSGLKKGDLVVADGGFKLKPGDMVSVTVKKSGHLARKK